MGFVTLNLDEVLRNTEQLTFDTAPLIYFIEKHPQYFDVMFEIMQRIDNKLLYGISSTVTLIEVLVHPMRSGNYELMERYESVLTDSRGFRLVPISSIVARRAAVLRASYNLKTPDAIHVATAIETGADAFLTNDIGLKRVNEIEIVILDDLESLSSSS